MSTNVLMQKLKILLIEDDTVDRMAIARSLQDYENGSEYEVVTAGSLAAGRREIANGQFDLAILDYDLGDGTAFDLIGEIENTPSILLTGAGSEELAINALRLGVTLQRNRMEWGSV